MHPRNLSDHELLEIVIGSKTAVKLYQGRLTPLMVGEGSIIPHKKLAAALELSRRLLEEELMRGPPICSSKETGRYLRTYFMGQPYESFVAVLLDNQHRVLRIEELFRGTIDGATVFPREVVRLALRWNAAACIFAHNHPSGVAEPSRQDQGLTARLRNALALIDVRVLDHIVVGSNEVVSMAERGMM